MGSARRTVAVRVGVLVAVLVLGVGGGWILRGAQTGPPGTAATGRSPSPSVGRPMTRPVVDGHLTFSVLEFGCGLVAVSGTHSEGRPEGEFCQVRLRVDNHDPAFHDYVARSQTIAGVAAPRNRPDPFAMAVRRQPEKVRIGGHNAVEVELWYDIAPRSDVQGLKLSGDRDPIGFRGEGVAPHTPGGVLVRLPPTDETPG